MSKEAKAIVDAKIHADVTGGMTKTAAAKKYGTSPRSVGRAIERHLASAARVKVATPKKDKAKTKGKTKVQHYEMNEGKSVAVIPVSSLDIGDTVVLSRNSEYASSHPRSNPCGILGVVTRAAADSEAWVDVNWSNGRHNVYPNGGREDLLLVAKAPEEYDYLMYNGDTIVVKTPTDAIPVGTRVVLRSGSSYADGPKSSNPVGIFGTLQQSSADGWVEVSWSNGKADDYPDHGVNDLLLLTSEEKKGDKKPTVLEALKSGMAVEYINTSSSVVLTLNNETEIVEETHPNFKEIQIAIVSGEFAKAFELMNIRKSIESFTRGAVSVKGDKLFYGNVEIKSSIVERILDLMRAGDEGFKTLVAFFEKLMENPSRDSVEQLWGFISHNDIEIDSEGYIIGWKKVREMDDGSLVDSRTRKVPNDIGNRVSMPRWMVDADKHVTCSQGLHVGAIGYVLQFSGDTIIKVRVHPRDVVSVPVDYHDQKMRVSAYSVICKADSNCKEIPVDDATLLRIKEDVVVGAAGELISRSPL